MIPNWVSKPIRRDLMWTPATRRQHNRESLRYETDLTDREWNLIAPMMPAAAKTGRPRGWPLREIMNAIFYVMRGGFCRPTFHREAQCSGGSAAFATNAYLTRSTTGS